jgi:surface polysaccharide O-acyltransferase-like enzyme
VGYFLLGGMYMNYRKKINKRTGKTALAFLIFCSMLFLTIYGIIMSKSNGKLFDVVFTGYATVFTLINVLATACLTENYRPAGIAWKVIRSVGNNTLGIYFIHVFIGNLLMPIYKTINISANIITNMFFALLVLLLSLLTSIILKRIPIIKELFKIG